MAKILSYVQIQSIDKCVRLFFLVFFFFILNVSHAEKKNSILYFWTTCQHYLKYFHSRSVTKILAHQRNCIYNHRNMNIGNDLFGRANVDFHANTFFPKSLNPHSSDNSTSDKLSASMIDEGIEMHGNSQQQYKVQSNIYCE